MARRANKTVVIAVNDRRQKIEVAIFNRPLVDYSGFGVHRKSRKAHRAQTRRDERNWRNEL